MEPVKNEDGMVAMKYARKQRALVSCGKGDSKRQYIFTTQANITLAWVEEEHVPCALAVRGGCCGQRKPGVIKYANEDDVRRWTNGGGR